MVVLPTAVACGARVVLDEAVTDATTAQAGTSGPDGGTTGPMRDEDVSSTSGDEGSTGEGSTGEDEEPPGPDCARGPLGLAWDENLDGDDIFEPGRWLAIEDDGFYQTRWVATSEDESGWGVIRWGYDGRYELLTLTERAGPGLFVADGVPHLATLTDGVLSYGPLGMPPHTVQALSDTILDITEADAGGIFVAYRDGGDVVMAVHDATGLRWSEMSSNQDSYSYRVYPRSGALPLISHVEEGRIRYGAPRDEPVILEQPGCDDEDPVVRYEGLRTANEAFLWAAECVYDAPWELQVRTSEGQTYSIEEIPSDVDFVSMGSGPPGTVLVTTSLAESTRLWQLETEGWTAKPIAEIEHDAPLGAPLDAITVAPRSLGSWFGLRAVVPIPDGRADRIGFGDLDCLPM